MSTFCNADFTNMSDYIYHNGRIQSIIDDKIFVKIIQRSACAGCHAQSMCSASDQKEKIIEVTDSSGLYQPDEEVIICGRTSLGMQAVVLAFIVPIVFMVSAIVIGNTLKWEETLSALIAIITLTIYYCLLYLMRDKLKRKFIFTIKKLNQ